MDTKESIHVNVRTNSWVKPVIILLILLICILSGVFYILQTKTQNVDQPGVNSDINYPPPPPPPPDTDPGEPIHSSLTPAANTSPESWCASSGGEWSRTYNECSQGDPERGFDEAACTAYGGNFNSCDSACRHDPQAQGCIDVCVSVCKFAGFHPTPVQEEVLCTQDAKQCADGSWVGRTGPNCEFVCPGR